MIPSGQLKDRGPRTSPIAGEEEELWRQFRETGADQARNRLFEIYLPLSRRLARKHFRDRERGDIEFQDLLQWGCAGLLEAIDRFDSNRGVPFGGFARKRISGSIVDGIAKASEYREQLGLYRRHQADRMRSLESEAVRSHDVAESYDAFSELVVGLALGFMLEDATGGSDAEANAYDSLVWKETVAAVHQVLDELPERERIILRGHYEGALGFDQLAAMLGVSKGRVSQIHRAALLTLRKRLKRNNPFSFSK